jgi:guanine deaminase
MSSSNSGAFRASILHFTDTPDPLTGQGIEYLEDGVLLVEHGRVKALASAELIQKQGFDLDQCQHFPDHLLMPGFIDAHIHYSQSAAIASYGQQLLDWLNHYIFPAELRFADKDFAAQAAEQFLQRVLENGTTSAMVYTTVFAHSAEAFFKAAARKNLRMIAGKVMMDRNAPDALLDTPDSSQAHCRALIEGWHQTKRLHYALTPRFAPTSSPVQLKVVGELYRQYPGLYLQTHLAENQEEVAWVKSLYPEARTYLDVYDRFGLLGSRSIFGHGIYLSRAELERLAQTQSGVAFCPTSNLFLGSGLLDLQRIEEAGVRISVATDVGAGTSFSMLRTLADAYKVLQLQGQSLHPLKGLFMATLGNARALQLDAYVGNFFPGKEADFVVLDLAPTPVQKNRQGHAKNINDMLFALMMLGDEHNIACTYVMGNLAFRRSPRSSADLQWLE